MIRIIFILFLVFSFNVYSHGPEIEIPNAKEKPTTSPRAIFVGDINKAPDMIMRAMPAGYLTLEKKDFNIEIATGDPNDLIAYFAIDEIGTTNVGQVMEWARKQGKTDVYFKYVKKS